MRSGLYRFGRWWLGELTGLLPRGLSRRLLDQSAQPVLEISDTAVRLWAVTPDGRRRQNQVVPLPGQDSALTGQAVHDVLRRSRRDPGTVCLHLPPEKVLERLVSLPDVGPAELDGLLAYELDRWMPVTGDDAVFAVQVTGRDPAERTATARLICVRPETLQSLTAQAGDGLSFAGFAYLPPDQDAAMMTVRTPDQRRALRSRSKRTALKAGLGAALGLLLLAGPVLLLNQEKAGLQTRLAEMRAAVTQVSAERQAAAQLQTQHARLGERLLGKTAPPDTLARLTAALPDGTWLDHLTMTAAGQLDVKGTSTDVSGVLAALDVDPAFRDVRFAAPTSIVPDTGLERFAITLSVATDTQAAATGEAAP